MENQVQNHIHEQEFPVLLQKDEALNEAGELLVSVDDDATREGKKKESDIYKNVLYQLDVNKIYLDPELSLVKFSSIVGTNTTYLSNTVNRCFGVNLKVLINRYRVWHAKRLMDMGDGYRYEDLADRCGFTSRSVFYTVFKRELGVSPRKYVQIRKREINY